VAPTTEKRDISLKTALERDVRLVRFEDGRFEFSPSEDASPQLAADIGKRLQEWTGKRWIVAVSSEQGQETLRDTSDKAKASKLADISAHPLVQAAFAQFPGAQIVEVRDLSQPVIDTNTEDDSFDFSALDHDFNDE